MSTFFWWVAIVYALGDNTIVAVLMGLMAMMLAPSKERSDGR